MEDLCIAPPVETNVLYDLMVTADKCSPRADEMDIVGWMSVLTDTPILLLRCDPENLVRGQKFLQIFMDQIEEAENV